VYVDSQDGNPTFDKKDGRPIARPASGRAKCVVETSSVVNVLPELNNRDGKRG
jgi:hypothetical protein